ncbi:MAG: molybdenum cofactor biosynthesis protein MoaE [Gammaproteobacteria bacterium]|nr:molybdenum cofactor biosynthesis protein MoaE [Gammaproteobacteria bacterium]MYF52329.1 molybdenum cofactor biosynthesis protein MoaE [Gammaproteobacteria bacterium]MYK42842.1 molybdenum cofactor biosynthesis protein MoaE [Gammaproteobacteria bacterium]
MQTEPIAFIEEWTEFLRRIEGKGGAVVSFSGIVREFNQDSKVEELYLEHYPEMTEQSIHQIIDKAHEKWELLDTLVIHRVGLIKSREQIVVVLVGAEHRAEAFSACEFIIDFLKTDTILWKKEIRHDGSSWIESLDTDYQRSKHWE